MEIIQDTPEKFIITLETNESLANAIRRSVLEIPILAIDEVEIFKNDSALYDEVLAHRLGLVPLKTEKSMNAKTSIDLKLSKTGPCTVYAGDLKGQADILYDKIPLTILGEDAKLELVATARLGKGTEHAKHIPGMCFYCHVLEVKSSPQIDKIIQSSNSGMIKVEKKGDKWLCNLNEAEIHQIEQISKNAISDSSTLIFVVESYGNISAKDIFLNAIKALELNLDSFEKEIK